MPRKRDERKEKSKKGKDGKQRVCRIDHGDRTRERDGQRERREWALMTSSTDTIIAISS